MHARHPKVAAGEAVEFPGVLLGCVGHRHPDDSSRYGLGDSRRAVRSEGLSLLEQAANHQVIL